MATKHFSSVQSGAVFTDNLVAVTSATDGDAIETRDFANKSVFINVTVNTGAVTVNIEGSPDGVNWYNLDSKTYSTTTGKDIYFYATHIPFMRTTTTTQSTSTVSTQIVGGRY